MKKIVYNLWILFILNSFLPIQLYAIKSRRARRSQHAQKQNNTRITDLTTFLTPQAKQKINKKEGRYNDLQGIIDTDILPNGQSLAQDIGTLQATSPPQKEQPEFDNQDTIPPIKQNIPTQEFEQKQEINLEAEKQLKNDLEDIEIELAQEKDIIEFHFEDADLEQLITQIEQLFDINFIRDDALNPLPEGGKAIRGNKISFKTRKALNKKQAWDLFITFLRLAGFAIVPEPNQRFYRITLLDKAKRDPVPIFIGTNIEQLPDNDQIIRYVYFIENSTIDVIKSVIEPLRSSTSSLTFLSDINAFLMIDHAYNIKSLMNIIKELDKVSMPQSMSVLKLQRADAQEVQQLYETLIQKETSPPSRLFPRKKPTARYFPENTRIIAEPRTNALILLGPQEAIKQIENFILKHVDVEIDRPYSPLKVYSLKYAEAETIAKIMNETVQFGKETQAGKVGGVRGGDKYLRDITFTAEPKTNRLIIKGEQEDYEKAVEIIKKLDEPQPQVAIEVLILAVQLRDNKELGVQLRSRQSTGGNSGLLSDKIKFQTSGLRAGGTAKSIVTNSDGNGVTRLLGDLINLVAGAPAGNTIVTLGQDAFGVWGIFQALQTISNTEILANPFLVATNKTSASVSVGEQRRVVTGTIIGTNQTDTFGTEPAQLKVTVTPQINSDGMIILKLNILIEAFTPDSNQVNVAKTTREIDTETIVADKEVLALGGLIQNRIDNNLSKTPLLGDVPVLGWLFKNKRKAQDKNNLLILISSRIIEPKKEQKIETFTQEKITGYNGMLSSVEGVYQRRDPIHHAFFAEDNDSTSKVVDDFLFQRHHDTDGNLIKNKNEKPRRRGRRGRKKQKKWEKQQLLVQKRQKEKAQQQAALIAQSKETKNSRQKKNCTCKIYSLYNHEQKIY